MKRREFITLVGGAAAVWPLAARAQQAVCAGDWVPRQRVGRAQHTRCLAMFRSGLEETGYVEGQNVTISDEGTFGPEIVRWREAEAGLCRGAAAEHASASGKAGPGRQPTAKERRDMVMEEKEFEPKG